MSLQWAPWRAVAMAVMALHAVMAAPTVMAAPVPVLDHPALASIDKDRPVEVPETVFHDWGQAEKEADVILDTWKTMPITVPWTRIQLGRYVKHKMMPTRGARGLALVHVAMHDALVISKQRGVEPRLAVSMAAAQVLAYLFPAEERAFDRIVFSLAARLNDVPRERLPAAARLSLAVGRTVGERVVDHAERDGAQRGWNGIRLQWYGEGRYYGPGAWEPTPPYFYYPPDEPYAPGWKTWALKSGDQFRPVPPAFNSPRFLADLREVIEVNKNLTKEQLEIARYWVDGHGSGTPPGHWNRIAMDELSKSPLSDEQATRMFLQLNLAEADAFVACWDAKYAYWTMRPVTAAKVVLGVTLTPPILTPPFPSYVSGHATFSGAAATVLGHYFPHRVAALNAMAEEAANSRLLGGIHYRHDNDDGLVLGRAVAGEVLRRYPLLPAPQPLQP